MLIHIKHIYSYLQQLNEKSNHDGDMNLQRQLIIFSGIIKLFPDWFFMKIKGYSLYRSPQLGI